MQVASAMQAVKVQLQPLLKSNVNGKVVRPAPIVKKTKVRFKC